MTLLQVFHGQPMSTTIPAAPHPPAMRPRVRARRGQATDPHSIAERVSFRIFSNTDSTVILANLTLGESRIFNSLISYFFFPLFFLLPYDNSCAEKE